MSFRYVTFDEALLVITAVHDKNPLDYIRDTVLLQSALERPAATLFGRDAYPDVYAKGAALLHSTLRNHALLDGNKRTGWVLCVLFFQLNGYEEHYDENGMFDFVLAVAAGEIAEIGDIAQRLADWFTKRSPTSPAG